MSELRPIDFAGFVPDNPTARLAEIVRENPAARDELTDTLRSILGAMESMRAVGEAWLAQLEKLGATS